MEAGASGINIEEDDITVDAEGRVVVTGELARELTRLKENVDVDRGRFDIDLNWKCR